MPKTKGSPADARTRILEAASEVVRREGALSLTLEAVAHKAGVSKGGLLYHFPSKEALVRGLLEHHLDQFERALDETGQPFAEAYVQLGSYDGSRGLFSGMLAALALSPELLEAVRQRYRSWQRRLPQSAEVWVAMLATDGLFVAEVLGIGTPQGEFREQVLRRMLELSRGKP